MPPRITESATEARQPDWSAVFAEAGLAFSDFSPVASRWAPPVYSDTRLAWEGTYPDRSDSPIRVEAGAFGGKPVYFEIVAPWIQAPGQRAAPPVPLLGVAGFVLIMVAAVLLARRNLRLGRGDRRGAFRLGLWYGASLLLSMILHAHEAIPSVAVLSSAAFSGLFAWTVYIAVEPHVRRIWPEAIIGWNRLLAGRIRDPLVGRDLLVGALAGLVLTDVTQFARIGLPGIIHLPPSPPVAPLPFDYLLLGGRWALSAIVEVFSLQVFIGLSFFLQLFVLNVVFRRRAVANVAMWAVLAVTGYVFAFTQDNPLFAAVLSVILGAYTVIVLLRFGLLATIVCGIVGSLTALVPISFDSSVPYVESSYFIFATVITIALYGFHTALAGRPVFGPGFLKDQPANSP
ncbi:MAG: hypothetical protein ACRD1Q_05570 [Vicinamibacterales bacterium]